MLAAATVGESGCLLGQHQIPDDAALTPLVPPSIVEDPSLTPMPGAMIVLPHPSMMGQPPNSVTFNLTLLNNSSRGLQARWIINRFRPCDQINLGNCGLLIGQPLAGDAGVYNITRPLNFRNNGCYYRVDFYASGAFDDSNGNDASRWDQPVRAGDMVHARWIVVTPNADGTWPDVHGTGSGSNDCPFPNDPDGQGTISQ